MSGVGFLLEQGTDGDEALPPSTRETHAGFHGPSLPARPPCTLRLARAHATPPLRASPQARVVSDLVLLSCVGVRPVMVHGGGPEINTWLGKLGIEAQFKNGLRVTDGARAMAAAGRGACQTLLACRHELGLFGSGSAQQAEGARLTALMPPASRGLANHPSAPDCPPQRRRWMWWRWCWAGA